VTEPDEAGALALEPASIAIDREVGVTLSWADGHVAQFELAELRVNCPCAACHQRRRAGEDVWPRSGFAEPIRMLDARLVGAFGIAFDWNDGHGTGIYNWEMLRRWSGG
jgi:prepilin-type processing-associated H-X9-DG protein